MGEEMLKKILLITFLVSIFCVFCIELKNNLSQIKMECIIEQTQNHENGEMIGQDETSHFQQIHKQNSSTSYWKIIEREDSYNNELQYYSKDNVIIKENMIEITSKKEVRGNKKYTSGIVESTRAYKYGYFEFSVMLSKGKGLFPAIWFLPNAGGPLPEIDLFEMIGSEPNVFYGVIHYKENGIQKSDYFAQEISIKDHYSVSLKWQKDALTWYIDNQEIYTTTQGVPQEYMYIIINQAIGGDWPEDPDDDTVFPNQFKVISKCIDPDFSKGRD